MFIAVNADRILMQESKLTVGVMVIIFNFVMNGM